MSLWNRYYDVVTFIETWMYERRLSKKPASICISAIILKFSKNTKFRTFQAVSNTSCDLGSVVTALMNALYEQTPQARLEMLHEAVDLGFRQLGQDDKRQSLNDLLRAMVRSAADLIQIAEALSCNTGSRCEIQEILPKYLQESWVSHACSQCMTNSKRRQFDSVGGAS